MIKVKILASGSKGNCAYISDGKTALLIDCGISYKKIQQGLNYYLSDIQSVLITHAHADHSSSAMNLINAGIDCYTGQGTADLLNLSGYRLNPVKELNQFKLGTFEILPFETEHDIENPLGFLLKSKVDGLKVLWITDSYYCKYKFNSVNMIAIECNYIKDTLDANIAAGLIDERMKPRLLKSHFSLEHVKEFLRANDLSQVREIILLHLSSQNSDAARMIKEVKEATGITPKIAKSGLLVELELYPY
jgi:phosphoribosyl 1,2-cyclic phosphodiesterase